MSAEISARPAAPAPGRYAFALSHSGPPTGAHHTRRACSAMLLGEQSAPAHILTSPSPCCSVLVLCLGAHQSPGQSINELLGWQAPSALLPSLHFNAPTRLCSCLACRRARSQRWPPWPTAPRTTLSSTTTPSCRSSRPCCWRPTWVMQGAGCWPAGWLAAGWRAWISGMEGSGAVGIRGLHVLLAVGPSARREVSNLIS